MPVRTYRISANPGDGIGTEVVSAGFGVLQAIARRDGSFAFEFDHFDWGGEYYKAHGRMMRSRHSRRSAWPDGRAPAPDPDLQHRSVTASSRTVAVRRVRRLPTTPPCS